MEKGLDLIDYICKQDEPRVRGKSTRESGLQGKCIGDCAAMTNSEDLRIVAFQVAGRVGDTNGWVSDAVLRLQFSLERMSVALLKQGPRRRTDTPALPMPSRKMGTSRPVITRMLITLSLLLCLMSSLARDSRCCVNFLLPEGLSPVIP